MDFFIDIGMAVLFRLLADKRIPAKYLKGLTKLRDALNIALPPGQPDAIGEGFRVV